jgi:hypothetical protein
MTKAEILAAVRNLVNEQSTDAGALLDNTGNLLDFVQDAQEQVVMDLVPVMPDQLLASEDVTITAGAQSTALTTTFWQVWRVLLNKSGETPRELRMIDPADQQYFHYIDQTEEEPKYCWFQGSSIYFAPKPSVTTAAYCRVYLIRPEAVTMPDGGPAYLPPLTHRLIVYQAAIIAGTAFGAITQGVESLYARRFSAIRKTWMGRFQQEPRYVQPGLDSRTTYDDRERAFYDKSKFFD